MKLNKSRCVKELTFAFGIGFAVALTIFSGVDYWLDHHSVQLRSPLVIQDKKIIEVVPTKTPEPTPALTKSPNKPSKPKSGIHLVPQVQAAESTQVYTPSDTEIIDYIKSKDWDDNIAVAVAKSENFWDLTKSFDCGRKGEINTNGTQDFGLWQINSIHINSGAITMEDALDCKKATDFAYGLYKGRGNTFSAWYAFTNGSYKNHL